MLDEVFQSLGLEVIILINHRQVLSAIAEAAGVKDKFTDLTVSIDKLDKIGWEGVLEDLARKNFSEEQINTIQKLFQISDSKQLYKALGRSEAGKKGLGDLEKIFTYLEDLPIRNKVSMEFTLARGLNYYTGAIFEVKAKGVKMGSIAGGGRYDDLTGVFGLKGVPGVGISFGVARIYDVMEELKLFPENVAEGIRLLILALDEESHIKAFRLLHEIRSAGIAADLYPEPAKMKKQMRYANQIGVPHTLIVGSEEIEQGVYTLKNMVTGNQERYTLDALIKLIQA
jgi:histidyl-tRNA synthetase